jgi:hypothetical protein
MALVAVGAFAIPAAAADFQMIGTWTQRRGAAVQIPLGGVDANTIVTQTGSLPHTVIFPVGAWVLTAVPGGTRTVPVPQPTFAQLATNFQITAPRAVTFASGETPQLTGDGRAVGGRVGNRLRANNWVLSDTRQYGAFAFCPLAPNNPNCANPYGGEVTGNTPNGPIHGRVIYTPGANNFGGTMQLALSTPLGPGDLAVSLGTQIGHRLVSGTDGPMALGINGGRYGQTDVNTQLPGVRTIPVYQYPNGVIKTGGPSIGAFGATSVNVNIGFPWTTGMVSGTVSDNGQPGVTTSHMFTGTDTRSAGGNGKLMLVAGGVTRRTSPTGSSSFVSADTITMQMLAPGTVPAMMPRVAAGAALLMIGAGFLLRKRLF